MFNAFLKRSPVRNEEAPSIIGSGNNISDDPSSLTAVPKLESCVQYDNFSKEWMGLSQQDTFDGFRIEAGKPLSKYLQSTHTLLLGTTTKQQPYSYQCGPVFQTENGKTFLMGKYSMDGSLNARMVQKVANFDFRANISSDMREPQRNMCELSKDFNGSNWSTSTKLVWQGLWIMNFGFSRLITPKLHMGGELTYLNLNQAASMGTLGLRYSDGGHNFSMTLGRTPDFKNAHRKSPMHGIRMQYVHKVSERVSLGAEYDYSYPDHESQMRLGYEYTFRTSRVQGLLDTAGRVSCYVNDFKGFGISGLVDYFNNDYKFGVLMHYFPAGGEGEEGAPMM